MPAIEVRRPLLYKMTHPGDPNNGCFGVQDCMGKVRARTYDAVIGIGGIGPMARSYNIDGKVDWVGLGPKKHPSWPGYRGPIVTFDHIKEFNGDGPPLRKVAPLLAAKMYDGNPRMAMTFSPDEWAEIKSILKLAEDAPSSHRRWHGRGNRPSIRLRPV
jgi:hypothetical protein